MNAVLPSIQLSVDYTVLSSEIGDFLQHYKQDVMSMDVDVETEEVGKGPKYMHLLQKVANRELNTVCIELDDIFRYQQSKFAENGGEMSGGTDLVTVIEENASHMVELFCRGVDKVMPLPTKEIDYKDDVLDVILNQRRLRNERMVSDRTNEIRNESSVDFNSLPSSTSDALRELVEIGRAHV